jgi:hypothetical protein
VCSGWHNAAMVRRTVVLLLIVLACNPSTGDTETEGGTGGSTGAGTSGSTGDASSATAEPTTGAEAVLFTSEVWPIFEAGCSCHTQQTPGPGGGAFFMGADAPTAYAALVDMPSSVMGLDIVEPGSTAKSYLHHKLVDTQVSVGGSGTNMPPGAPLGADDLATISAWIDAGALE